MACLMFVDDLDTFSHTIEGVEKQYKTVIKFALRNGAVINTGKSTASSSESEEWLRGKLNKVKIPLKVEAAPVQ